MEMDQDLDFELSTKDQIERELEEPLNPRSKTSLRMHYEAQVSVIKKQLGTLEDVRLKLGLSQRKMSQLLLVDPSSWTRWNRPEDEAPPHIWRALQWYLTLQEKIPGLTAQYFLGSDPKILHEKALRELEVEKSQRESDMNKLFEEVRILRTEKANLDGHLEELKKDLKFHKNISILGSLFYLFGVSLLFAFLFAWKG